MRNVLESLAAGEIGVTAAQAQLAGYVETDAGRFDAARGERRGIPEAILADGKQPAAAAALVETAIETTGRAVVTRADAATTAVIEDRLAAERPDATVSADHGTILVEAASFDRPSLDVSITVVTGGTADRPVAREAAVAARTVGATVTTIEDVGVANIDRVLDVVEQLRAADVIVTVAGRENALSTVVAGLVDAPVIAVPTSTGYGVGGAGEAALQGALQSCTVLTTVNVDAGYVAGSQAGLIARGIARS